MTSLRKHFVFALLLTIVATAFALTTTSASARPSHHHGAYAARSSGDLRVMTRSVRHRHAKRRHVAHRTHRARHHVARKSHGQRHMRAAAHRAHRHVEHKHRYRAYAHRDAARMATRADARFGGSRAMFGGSRLVSEARRWIGGNPTTRRTLWCARFMNFVLRRIGLRGTGSDLARSFASYGRRIGSPRVGAIAVISRGRRGGHVGVVSGIDRRGNPIIVSGNHGNRVAEAAYSRGRVYAYVLPAS